MRFVIPLSLLFTARNARVEATTIAADEESPEPAGTVPETSKSTGTGSPQEATGEKNLLRTPYTGVTFIISSNVLGTPLEFCTHVISGFDITLPVKHFMVDAEMPFTGFSGIRFAFR